jgi:sugar/nucleoside kinase (ribokinase family)
VVNKHHDAIRRLLPFADIVFAKEKEALALASVRVAPQLRLLARLFLFPDLLPLQQTNIPEEAACSLSLAESKGTAPRVVVVTRGTQPTIVAREGRVR